MQAGGTVVVAAGTYRRERGRRPRASTSTAPGPSTIVVPGHLDPELRRRGGSLCAGASNVFLVQADDVEIDHLTVDGDNPALTGLVGRRRRRRRPQRHHHQPRRGHLFNGLSVHDVTVKNIYLRGIYASSGGTFNISDNTVDNVQGDAASIGIFNFDGGGTISRQHGVERQRRHLVELVRRARSSPTTS